MKPIKIEVPLNEENEENSIDIDMPEVEIEKEDIEIDFQNHTVNQKLIPGPKGDDGLTPTDEQLIALIEPRIPKLKQPKDGKTPTRTEIKEIIKEVLPEDKLIEKIVKKVPRIKGDKGDKGDTLRFADLTAYEKQILTGPQGSNGIGVPRGGADGQILAKSSSRDFDTEWIDNSGGGGAVDSVNGQTGVVVLDQDDIGDGTTYKQYSQTEKTKLAGIETGAEVNTIDTVSDTTEIDLAITARDLTATLKNGSIDESKLDTSVNASLDLADSALQSSAIGVSVQAYSSVLQNTTASFTTTDETKLDNITVTQAVNLDTMEADINALANGMVYKGNWDASAGTFPGAGSAQTGWFYTVSVGGTVDSVVFNVGDRLIATTDNASTTTYAGNWTQLDATDAVTSVFGRTGNVTATNGDYTASNITNVPAGNIAATDVQAALNELDGDKQATLVSGTNIKTVNSTSLLGSGNLAVGDVTKVGTPANNQVGVWTGDGTIEGATRLNYDDGQIVMGDVSSKSASYDVIYGYSATNAFTPMVRLQKVTFGSILSLNAYSQSPVIDATGGNTFVSYSQTDTSTSLANSYAGGATLSMRNDNDNYATYGIKGVGSNQNSAPSTGRAYSYGLWGTAQGHTSGNGGAVIYGQALSANIDGIRVDLASGQTAPAINIRDNAGTSLLTVHVNSSGTGISNKPLLKPVLVEANTAGSGSPNIITSTESGSLYTNEGATALNYHTLPTAVAGLTYTFYVDDADGIRVTANTGDIIQINGVASASAGYAECTAIGGCLTLTAINATDWVATSVIGSWSLT